MNFPPLFQGHPTDGDPFGAACDAARKGCDAGLVCYNLSPHILRAAIVFAPEVSRTQAMAMLPLCGVGFQNALGALAPPEVAVHLDWDGGIRVNGAICGKLRVSDAGGPTAQAPDWLIIGLALQLWPDSDDPGDTPDKTSLYAEGCADVQADTLLEAWVRHTLVGINRWTDEGAAPLHKDWIGLAHGIDETTQIDGKAGVFVGVDEHFGMLLRDDATTHLIPLTYLLED